MLSLTFRTWIRYLVPLTCLAAVTMVLVELTAVRAGLPGDVAAARIEMHLGWELAATAWIFQLVLVAGAAPMVRAVATDAPLTQTAALWQGLRGVARAFVPIGMAVFAIVLGSVALVIPGLVLLGLFSLTGASDRLDEPLPAALIDSAATVRAHAKQVALVIAIMIAADTAIALAAHVAILPSLGKKPAVTSLVAARSFVRAIALALVVVSALPACALAAIYGAKRQTA